MRASRVLKEVTQTEPSFVFAWLALGDVCLERGDRAGAADSAKRAQALAGKIIPAWKALAMLAVEHRNSEAAGTVADAALLRFPADPDCCACEVSRGTAWAESRSPSHFEYV